ncbi:hypothetical protein GF402_11470 [Candidatus Fermentibacteria bacterium]|nr:hypothetical protein [Candidatus Fermentibacteria bacterium]
MRLYSSLLVVSSILLLACGGEERADSDTAANVEPAVAAGDTVPATEAGMDTTTAEPDGPAGTWSTTMGELSLEMEGDLVTGDYPLGTLEGELDDTTLRFEYTESSLEGEGVFEFDRGFESFTGHQLIGDQEVPWEGARLEGTDG